MGTFPFILFGIKRDTFGGDLMLFLKIIIYIVLFTCCYLIGALIAKKYANRVSELKDFRNALNMFKTKIKFTYEPIPDIFKQICNSLDNSVGNVFKKASENMKYKTAEYAWVKAIEEQENLNLTKEDIDVLKNLGKLLGKVDIEGQTRDIELVESFLDTQIDKSEKEKATNEKLYKTLGIVCGFVLVIILI